MANLISDLEGPRTSQQELFYDLDDTTAIIGWSVAALKAIEGRSNAPDDAATLMKICVLLAAQHKKLSGYADEVKAGRIARAKPE
jgi:hypothetical protein